MAKFERPVQRTLDSSNARHYFHVKQLVTTTTTTNQIDMKSPAAKLLCFRHRHHCQWNVLPRFYYFRLTNALHDGCCCVLNMENVAQNAAVIIEKCLTSFFDWWNKIHINRNCFCWVTHINWVWCVPQPRPYSVSVIVVSDDNESKMQKNCRSDGWMNANGLKLGKVSRNMFCVAIITRYKIVTVSCNDPYIPERESRPPQRHSSAKAFDDVYSCICLLIISFLYVGMY